MWLDEIEDTAWREQKGDAMLIVGRMARVLRETVAYNKLMAEAIDDEALCHYCQEKLQNVIDKGWEELSDDAKELLR